MKKITMPDGTKTNVPQRFDYKFCVAIRICGETWFSSWAMDQDGVDKTKAMWNASPAKNIEFQVIAV